MGEPRFLDERMQPTTGTLVPLPFTACSTNDNIDIEQRPGATRMPKNLRAALKGILKRSHSSSSSSGRPESQPKTDPHHAPLTTTTSSTPSSLNTPFPRSPSKFSVQESIKEESFHDAPERIPQPPAQGDTKTDQSEQSPILTLQCATPEPSKRFDSIQFVEYVNHHHIQSIAQF